MEAHNAVPDGFKDDGSNIDAQITCENCGVCVTIGVRYGENYADHECYNQSHDETRGVPANGF